MKQEQQKVVKFKKPRTINIGVIVFFVIFIYLAIAVYQFFTKPHLSIFEVQLQTLAQDTIATGVVLREETLVHTDTAGYVNYYLRDRARAAKDTTVYSLDSTRAIYDTLSNAQLTPEVTGEAGARLRKEIRTFRSGFSTETYKQLAEFETALSLTLQELTDESLLTHMQALIDNTGVATNFQVGKTTASGIVCYTADTLTGLTAEQVNALTFDTEGYRNQSLVTTEPLTAGGAVYRLVTDEHWQLMLELTEAQFTALEPLSRVKLTVLKDNFTLQPEVETLRIDGQGYALLTFQGYMVRYINDRFLEVSLDLGDTEGYKIPLTAITTKTFYLIPEAYLIRGGDSNEWGVLTESFDSVTGEVTYTFLAAETYYEEEGYVFVDQLLLEPRTSIYSAELDSSYTVTLTAELEGVYNVNRGYAVFRRIERLTENDEYCIVKKGSQRGITLYDHIALDASTVQEAAIIY